MTTYTITPYSLITILDQAKAPASGYNKQFRVCVKACLVMPKEARSKSPTPQVFTLAEVNSSSREYCNACNGKHLAHTCGKLTRKIKNKDGQAFNENSLSKKETPRCRRMIGPNVKARSADLSICALPNDSTPAQSPMKSSRASCYLPSKYANKKVVKSLSALSNNELRQALPTNYGDTVEEIHTVSVSYTG